MQTGTYFPALVTSADEIQQIAVLSEKNLRFTLSAEEKNEQGFISWQYSPELITQMQTLAPSIIIKWNDQVVGYALTAFKEAAVFHKDLHTMIGQLDILPYRNGLLADVPYYIMGQICIDKEHRGKGLFGQLYLHHKTTYQQQFELLVTEISTSNLRSMRAHRNVGFETIHTYKDELDEWNVVVWDWR